MPAAFATALQRSTSSAMTLLEFLRRVADTDRRLRLPPT